MKRWLSLVIALCLAAVVFTGCGSSEDNALETTQVARGDLLITVSVSGNLEMPHKTDLSFGTTGMVAEVLVDDGDPVTEGQVLARLDAQSLEVAVAVAETTYEAARVDYKIAETNLAQTIYPHYLNTYGFDVAGVWLSVDEAHDNLSDAREALEAGDIEGAQTALDLLERSIDKCKEKSGYRVWALPLTVKLTELQLDKAKTVLDSAELGLVTARLNLAKATITAPFSGIAAEVMIDEGEQLSTTTYANPAICLIDTAHIEMSGVIDEIDIASVKLGQDADIILDALQDKEVGGIVAYISQAGTIQSGVVSYKTTIALKEPDDELRDGMSATADIIIERRDNILLVPNRAIQGSWDEPWVEVIVDGQSEQRQITLGLSDGIRTEALSGLEEGEKVVFPETELPFRMFG